MTEPHKIWIEQCEAACGIEDEFGAQKALKYLVAEKFLNFLEAADRLGLATERKSLGGPLDIDDITGVFSHDNLSAEKPGETGHGTVILQGRRICDGDVPRTSLASPGTSRDKVRST